MNVRDFQTVNTFPIAGDSDGVAYGTRQTRHNALSADQSQGCLGSPHGPPCDPRSDLRPKGERDSSNRPEHCHAQRSEVASCR